jgi:uncharacterized membrane protein YjgN (DUF898 family)
MSDVVAGGMPLTIRSDARAEAGIDQSEARPAFDLATPGLMQLFTVGSILQFITIGIYRFWFLVQVRRQLWQRTSLIGSPFEFTGTPGEVFRGFLISLIFLAPIWGLYFAGSTLLKTTAHNELAATLTGLAIFSFLIFGSFASYRSNRYRVSRTLWRGVRFRMTGSGLLFALMTIGWWLLAIATLGFSIPFARAQLERYRTNNIYFGDRKFESRASGAAMFGHWLVMILVVIGPAAFMLIQWYFGIPHLAQALQSEFASYVREGGSNPRLAQAELALIFSQLHGSLWGFGTLVGMALLAWPAYRAAELRSFIERTRLGDTRFRSDFQTWAIYQSFLAFIFAMIFWAIVIGAVAVNLYGSSLLKYQYVTVGYTIFAYLGMLLAFSTMRLRFLVFGLNSKLIHSLTISGIGHLMTVVSRSDTVSAIGDDFAGGFDIGAI